MCHWCYLVYLIPAHWLVTLSRSLFWLFVSWLFVSCLACQPHTDLFHVVTGFVSFAFTVFWLTLNRSLLQFYYIWHCLLTRHWFVQCQQHLYIGIILQYSSGSVAADFEQLAVSLCYFFTWLRCIYIILDKGYHILYVFGLNSMVCSQIVGMICLVTRSLMTLW